MGTRIAVIALATVILCGCSLTPQQQKWAGIGLTVIAVGAIAAHREDSGALVTPTAQTPTVDCANSPQLCR